MLNDFFTSIFVPEDVHSIPTTRTEVDQVDAIIVYFTGILKLIDDIKLSTSSEANDNNPKLLQSIKHVGSDYLELIVFSLYCPQQCSTRLEGGESNSSSWNPSLLGVGFEKVGV